MDELHDSLDEVNEGIPTVIDRNIDTQVTDHLINSLGNSDMNQSSQQNQNFMQTGPFMVQEAPAGSEDPLTHVSGQFDFTRIGLDDNPPQGSGFGHRRSGPEGSPAFNQSRGFLPSQTTDDESVIFRPVRQLDFSALDDTERTEDVINRSVSTPQRRGQELSYMTAEREEVYGSQDMDAHSRNESPAAAFYEMRQSPRQSSDSGEELDSKVIFSPLNTGEPQEMTGNVSRFEFQRYLVKNANSEEMDQHDSNHYQEPNLAKPSPNSSELFYTSPTHSLPNYMSPGEVRGKRINSPGNSQRQEKERREVFVSMPSLSHRESFSSPQNQIYSQSDAHSHESREPDNSVHMSHDNPRVNAAWEIAVSDSSQITHFQSKDMKPHSKQAIDRRPFVSSVRNETHNAYLQRKETQLPRPKTKGSDAIKTSAGDSRFQLQRNEPPQAQKGHMQRNTQEEVLRVQQREKKVSGPIPSHTESRIMARKNVSMNNDRLNKQSKSEQSRKMTEEEERHMSRSYPGRGQTRPGEHSPVHPGNNVVTQIQQYDSSGDDLRQNNHTRELNVDVFGMEGVRSQLQNMLKFSSQSRSDMQQYEHDDNGLMMTDLMPAEVHVPQEAQDYSVLSGKGENVSDLLENFPSFTSQMWTDPSNLSRSESSIHSENQRLREVLEKERYRRKHCEQYIQKLNVKLLETQQQLAVAISTDKRKDIMIEQLDKQLAKVVEGWKSRDEEKENQLKKLKSEKAKVDEKLGKQNEMIKNFEKDMAEALEQMRRDKDTATTEIEGLKSQILEKERARLHAEELLEGERERCQLINQEWENLKETRDVAEKKVHQMQDRLRNEQDEWFRREQELLQKIDEVSENNQKVLNQEQEKCEEAVKLCKDMEEKMYTLQTESRKFEMELDAVVREKESLKIEMGIMEAKFESSQRSLEADLHSQMEKEIAEQIADVHKRMEETENEIRQNHRQQIKELNQRHAKDMEKNMARFHETQKNKDEEYRKLSLEYEKKLQEQCGEITSLLSIKQKLESQRSEILMKLQYMMQSQWNEAVQMLASTPQKKNLANTSFSTQTSTVNANNTSLPSHAAFPITSSPGRDSHAAPPLEPNVSDLTNSHIQQFFQSLAHPAIIPHSSFHTDRSNDTLRPGYTDVHNVNQISANQISDQRGTGISHDRHQLEGISQNRLQQEEVLQGRLEHDGISQERISTEEIPHISPQSDNHNIPNWHPSTLEAVYKPETSFASDVNQIQSSNLSVSDLVSKFQGLSQHQSNGFFPQTQSGEFIPHLDDAPVSYQSTAVPIRPPQHGNSHITNQNTQESFSTNHIHDRSFDSVRSTNQMPSQRKEHLYQERFAQSLPVKVPAKQQSQSETNDSAYWSQRNVSHSPPTKQSRSRVTDDGEGHSLTEEGIRLNDDYLHLSQRVDEHESKQGQLQHYIQMLLQKPPGDPVVESADQENTSMYSQDQTEDELNDTDQAVQIQQELNRIQQLRDKQQKTQNDPKEYQSVRNPVPDSTSKIMQPEQLAEISKLLNFYKPQTDSSQVPVVRTARPEEEQMMQLLSLFQHMQQIPGHDSGGLAKPDVKKVFGVPLSPRSQNKASGAPLSPHSQNKGVKRNLKEQISAAPENQVRGDKQGLKVNQQKKPERKIAPSAKPGQAKSKSAWK